MQDQICSMKKTSIVLEISRSNTLKAEICTTLNGNNIVGFTSKHAYDCTLIHITVLQLETSASISTTSFL